MARTNTPAQQKAANKNLVKFTKGSEHAREAGRKGGLRRAALAAGRTADTTVLAANMAKLQSEFAREDVAPTAVGLMLALMLRVEAGEIEVDGKDVAELIKTLFDLVRLESGEATSQTVTAHLSDSTVMEKLRELRGLPSEVEDHTVIEA